MKYTDQPIKAAPTARGNTDFDGRRNILEDALYEMGYDDTLVDILIARNIIDFSIVNYTSDIQYQLREHYGESVLWGNLEDAVAFEDLTASLTGKLGESWRAAKGDTFRERIQHIITDPIEMFGMKVTNRYELEDSSTLSEELEAVKRHLMIDYGEFNSYLPDVDLIIYTPENFDVIAVISCAVDLKNRIIEQAYWKRKLQAEKKRTSIKFYLIATDLDETLKVMNSPKRERIIAETDLDGTYVLTAEALEESDKVRLFEHFIEDFKKLIEQN